MLKGKIEDNRNEYYYMMQKALSERNLSDALIIIMMCRVEDTGLTSQKFCEAIDIVIDKFKYPKIDKLMKRAGGCWGAIKKSYLRKHMDIVMRDDPLNFGNETIYAIKRDYRETHKIEDAIKLSKKKLAGYRRKNVPKNGENIDARMIISEILNKKTGKITITIDP